MIERDMDFPYDCPSNQSVRKTEFTSHISYILYYHSTVLYVVYLATYSRERKVCCSVDSCW